MVHVVHVVQLVHVVHVVQVVHVVHAVHVVQVVRVVHVADYSMCVVHVQVPTNNPLESFNRGIKRDKVVSLRAATETLLNTTFPRMLVVDAAKHVGEVTYSIVPTGAVPQTVFLRGAASILEGVQQYHKISYASGKSKYFFNAMEFVGTKVTKERCDYYLQSLRSGTTLLQSVKRFHEACLSLHMVVDDPQHDIQCDCRCFYRGLVCAHVVAVAHLKNELDLDKLLQHCPDGFVQVCLDMSSVSRLCP